MGIIADAFSFTPTGMIVNALGETFGPTVLAASDQAADIDAIHEFFTRTEPINNKAQDLKDDWMRWRAGLTWHDRNINENVGAEAFNRRNEFMRANAQSQAELDRINEILKKVPAFDPVTGKPNFVDSKGDRIKAPEPIIPTPYKVAGVIGAAAVVVLVVLKKLTIL